MEILKRYLCLGILIFFISIPISARAQLVLHEQDIKAGLLYNFLKYTQWPAAKLSKTSDSIEVCIFGSSEFDKYLKPMAGRSVNQKKINVQNVYTVSDVDKCDLLFVNEDKKALWPELAEFLANKPVLTVGDFSDFGNTGGMIEFSIRNSHVTAQLNLKTLTSAQLYVSDRLLRLVSVSDNSSFKNIER